MPRTDQWDNIFKVIAAIDEVCVKNGRAGHGYTEGMKFEAILITFVRKKQTGLTLFRKRSGFEGQHCAEARGGRCLNRNAATEGSNGDQMRRTLANC